MGVQVVHAPIPMVGFRGFSSCGRSGDPCDYAKGWLRLIYVDMDIAFSLDTEANLWHRRMGHLNARSLKVFNSAADNGVNSGTFSSCDICSVEKSKQAKPPEESTIRA